MKSKQIMETLSVISFLLFLLFSSSYIPSIVGKPPRKVIFPDDSLEDYDFFVDPTEQLFKFQPTEVVKVNKSPIERKNIQNIKNNALVIRYRIDSRRIPCTNSSMPFCESVGDSVYPFKYVETKLKATGKLYKEFFNKTAAPATHSLQIRLMPSGSDTKVDLCESFRRLIYPQLAMNVHNDWRFVINQPNYQQPIHVEICQRKSGQCLFNDSFPNGYTSKCIQKHTKVHLLSLGEDGEIVSYEYEFPSHCQCELFHT